MIRGLVPEDVPAVTSLLVRCFAADPGYSNVFPADRRDAMLGFLMERLLRLRLEAGSTVWVVDEGGPVATSTFAPDTIGFGVADYLRHGLAWMPLRFGLRPVRRMLQADAAAGALRKAHAPDTPYVWIAQIAVDPAAQGRGLARTLGEAMLDAVDAEGLPAATMTTRPELVELYGRGGFVVRGSTEVLGFTTWFLVRPAGG